MCMLFILRLAQRGCERELRGVQRLLCTLLCTRSNPYYSSPVHPSAAPASSSPRLVLSADDCTPFLFCNAKKLYSGIRIAVPGPPSFGRRPRGNSENICPRLCFERKTKITDLEHSAKWGGGVKEIDHCLDSGPTQSRGGQQFSEFPFAPMSETSRSRAQPDCRRSCEWITPSRLSPHFIIVIPVREGRGENSRNLPRRTPRTWAKTIGLPYGTAGFSPSAGVKAQSRLMRITPFRSSSPWKERWGSAAGAATGGWATALRCDLMSSTHITPTAPSARCSSSIPHRWKVSGCDRPCAMRLPSRPFRGWCPVPASCAGFWISRSRVSRSAR
jgi:hypothetical protein